MSLFRERETAAEMEAGQERKKLCTTDVRASQSGVQRHARSTKNRVHATGLRTVVMSQKSNFYEEACFYDPVHR